jgi:hypothetical protein
MPGKILVSFKQSDELEQEILSFLKEKSKLIGQSAYIKQLIYEEMMRENPKK